MIPRIMAERVETAARLEAIRERATRVAGRIERARARTDGAPVSTVAVTKGHPFEVVEAALDAGFRLLGENRVQELDDKARRLADAGRADEAEWHLIGHLQRNKVRQALPLFDLIHSVDSPRLARELSKEAVKAEREVRGLVQVNTSGEGSKSGFEGDADAVVAAVAELAELPGLRLVGMMTMAPFTDDEATLRRTFAGARELWQRCGREVAGFEARHLSMGMSNDYEIAVEEGSTMVRLGTVLFGERDA